MKFSIIASIFALASIGMAAPSPDDAVKINQALANYEKITSLKARAAAPGATLNKRGPCPEPGSGNIDPCCFDGGPDENCQSRSNCYTRCGPSGPNDIGGPLGCLAGKLSLLAEVYKILYAYNFYLGCASVCPSDPVC
ncbi:uncharacterized protein N0V89_008716 [Didymosphaeria variabile]|uniref:Hydrophobin n=1 Tax=Didymosphaeria variabile TaxID=1932322 RepID=A0A9W8XGT5_9PLEO|nr:uncharacterized protein N0V89_008716 [Didymosphaeria variabile]KAJ4350095.1 hypothetical protein N0V89_008716 [Didymosphaeria variabile]